MKFYKVLSKRTPLKWYIVLSPFNAIRFFKGLALEFKGNMEQRWGREKAKNHSEGLLQVNWVWSLTRIFQEIPSTHHYPLVPETVIEQQTAVLF